jgi:hypothetical protein
MLILDLKEYCRKSPPKKSSNQKSFFSEDFTFLDGKSRDNLFMVHFFLNIPLGLISIIKLWILSTHCDLFQENNFYSYKRLFKFFFFLHEITKSTNKG